MELTPADITALRAMAEAHPWSALPMVLLMRHGAYSESELPAVRARLAAICADPRTTYSAAYGDRWSEFYPESELPARPDTTDVIDTFLRTYGSCTPEEEKLLERMIFNPTPDYAEMLARQEQTDLPDEADDEASDPRQARINAFIRSQHPAAAKVVPEPQSEPEAGEEKTPIAKPVHSDDSLLSESLAKFFIKQGRYERAYEIISA